MLTDIVKLMWHFQHTKRPAWRLGSVYMHCDRRSWTSQSFHSADC